MISLIIGALIGWVLSVVIFVGDKLDTFDDDNYY